jgi:nucleoside-diphosphate-sugar epimerase
MSRPLAAVTGATGFLGAQLVRALSAQGYAVRVLARREPSAPGWGEADPEVVAGDLADEPALRRLLRGAEVVVHAAGAIKAPDLAGFMAVNRDGVTRVAELAIEIAPAARFLLVSSLAAREPQLSDYAASKRAGEAAATALWPLDRLTIVRPPAIYGPGDRETLTVFQAAAWAPILPVPSARGRLALIHVADAAAQTAALAGGPAGLYALADARPEGYGWREIFQAAADACGRRPLLVNAPPWLLPGLAGAAGFIARMNGGPPILTEGKLRELLHPDWSVSAAELAPNRPPAGFGLQEGFTDTVDWYFRNGCIRLRHRAKSPH